MNDAIKSNVLPKPFQVHFREHEYWIIQLFHILNQKFCLASKMRGGMKLWCCDFCQLMLVYPPSLDASALQWQCAGTKREAKRYCQGPWYLWTLTFGTSSSTEGWGCSRSDTSSKICKRMSRKNVSLCWYDLECSPRPLQAGSPRTGHTMCPDHWPLSTDLQSGVSSQMARHWPSDWVKSLNSAMLGLIRYMDVPGHTCDQCSCSSPEDTRISWPI